MSQMNLIFSEVYHIFSGFLGFFVGGFSVFVFVFCLQTNKYLQAKTEKKSLFTGYNAFFSLGKILLEIVSTIFDWARGIQSSSSRVNRDSV